MHMKNSKIAHDKIHVSDTAIHAGHLLYEKWKREGYTSRKIARQAELAAASARADSIGAVSCLFALYMRIKERYADKVSRIIFYFSLKREMYALQSLEKVLHIAAITQDVHTAIEVDLKKLGERIKIDDIIEDGDDTTHGGKHTEIPDEIEVDINSKKLDQAANNKQDEQLNTDESREATEQKNEEATRTFSEKPTNEATNNQQVNDARANDVLADNAHIFEAGEREQGVHDAQNEFYQHNEFKEEINAADQISEQIIDTHVEIQAQNTEVAETVHAVGDLQQATTAAPSTVITEEAVFNNTVEMTDDSYMNTPLKDNIDVLSNRPQEEVPEDTSYDEIYYDDLERNARMREGALVDDNAPVERDEASTRVVPDAMHGEYLTLQKVEREPIASPKIEQELVAPPKVEQKPKAEQKPVAPPQNKQEKRVPIQVDLMADVDNETAINITNSISTESVVQLLEYRAEVFREQVNLTLAELGLEEMNEVIGLPNMDDIKQASKENRR